MEFDREEMRRELAKVRDEFTCSKNERAFLGEIRENGNYIIAYNKIEIKHDSDLYQSDFTKTNLSELVEGEG